jgi:hypothetical protein
LVSTARLLPTLLLLPVVLASQTSTAFVPYSDAKPIFEALREDLVPAELRGLAAAERERAWPGWVMRRDAEIRARVAEGDEDSVINLLQFGTSFTAQPRITEQQLAGVVMRQAGAADVFVPSPVLKARIDDFIAALVAPGTNGRVVLARRVVERRGFNPSTADGRERLRRYLEERTAVVGSAVHAPVLHDPSTGLALQEGLLG